MMNYLVIGLGGFAGAVSRYIVALWIGERWGRSFPLGTVLPEICEVVEKGLVEISDTVVIRCDASREATP